MKLYAVIEDEMLCDERVCDFADSMIKGVFIQKIAAEMYQKKIDGTVDEDTGITSSYKIVELHSPVTDFHVPSKEKK